MAEGPPAPSSDALGSAVAELQVQFDEHGCGRVLYPSGRVAVSVAPALSDTDGKHGKLHVFMEDAPRASVLGSFDAQGVGSFNFAAGNPRLVVNLASYMLCDAQGQMQEYPLPPTQPTPTGRALHSFKLSPHLQVDFHSRQSIRVTYSNGDVRREFEVGEQLRRTDSYLEHTLGYKQEGTVRRVQFDVEAIRARPAVYTAQGGAPVVHAPPVVHDAGLAASVSSMSASLAQLSRQLHSIPPYNPATAASRAHQGLTTTTTTSATSATSASARASKEEEEEEGEAPAASSLLRRARPASLFVSRRLRLRRVPLRRLRSHLRGMDPSVLVVVFCTASYVGRCSVECVLESANWKLGRGEALSLGGVSALPPESVSIVKVDMGEGRELQERYNFFMVPMFLFFQGGKLAYASNAFYKGGTSEADLCTQLEHTLRNCKQGMFLPDTFQFSAGGFSGEGPSLLDSVAHMQLPHAGAGGSPQRAH